MVSADSCSLAIVSSRWDYAKHTTIQALVELDKRINSCSPGTIDKRIIDGIFFLHLFDDLPVIFGPLEKLIFLQVCKQRGMEIHLVFDKIISPSIKNSKSNKRDNNR